MTARACGTLSASSAGVLPTEDETREAALPKGRMLALAALTIALELAGWALAATAQQRAPPAPQPSALEGVHKGQHLYARGMELLARGDLDAARKYFERAADAGHAQSAVALAETYDPYEFARLKVFGLQPNLNVARKWYLRARELGADIDERLRRLEGR